MDDFLTVGGPNSTECIKNMEIMLSKCKQLGMPLKAEKIEGHSPVLPFLGITLDTQRQEIRLPEKKLQQLKSLVTTWRDCIMASICIILMYLS